MHFFFNDTATTEIYTLSLHDALPISILSQNPEGGKAEKGSKIKVTVVGTQVANVPGTVGKGREEAVATRSEEHTSELQSRQYLVCRLLLEKKKKNGNITTHTSLTDAR